MCVCGSSRIYTHLETIHSDHHLVGVVTLDTVGRLNEMPPRDVVQLVDGKLGVLRSAIYRSLGHAAEEH